jgi:uncharacterized protein YqhQ
VQFLFLQINSELLNGIIVKNMIRKILSIVAGYAVFVVSSVILFEISGQDPHENASITFIAVSSVYGAFFSFVGGFVVQLIAKSDKLSLNYILAFIIAGFAAFSLIKLDGNHWTQIIAMVIFAPLSILGGLFYMKRKTNFKHK